MAETRQRERKTEDSGGSNHLAQRKAHCCGKGQTAVFKGIGSFFLQVPLAYDFSRSHVASLCARSRYKPSDPDSSRCLPRLDPVHGSSSSSCAVPCQHFSDFCPHSLCVTILRTIKDFSESETYPSL